MTTVSARNFAARVIRAPAVAILLTCLGMAQPALAADANQRCVQAFLELKGYDPGLVDGKATKQTFAAAQAYKGKKALSLADLSADNAGEWCAMAKADPEYAKLLSYSYNTSLLWNHGAAANTVYDQVLVGDSVGKFEPAERNIRNPGALAFVDLNNGLAAARITVKYADKGPPKDWSYNNKPGVQQRFELTERRSFSMKSGKTYWLRISIFVPATFKTPLVGDQLDFTDFKPMTNGKVYGDPLVDLKLNAGALQVNDRIARKSNCVIAPNDNTICDFVMEQDAFLYDYEYRSQWLNLVYRVHWANDQTGRYHLWLNDKLIVGLAGSTTLGAEYVTNKFGMYRGYYASQGMPQPDASMYYTAVGRSESCEGLGLDNCAALEADVETIGTPGVLGTHMVEQNDMTEYLKGGGKVKR